MPHDALSLAIRLPLLFRGDAMRQSSLAVLAFTSPLLLVFLGFKLRAGMRLQTASVWAFLGLYASWAAGLLFGEAFVHGTEPHLVSDLAHWVNLVPFTTIASQIRTGAGGALVQLVGNVGLLLPLGLLGPLVMPSLRRAPRLLLVALVGSVGIEVVQFVGTSLRMMSRSVDVDDVILNVAGALLGWLLWRTITALRARAPRTIGADETTS